jgi:hypothetical protein
MDAGLERRDGAEWPALGIATTLSVAGPAFSALNHDPAEDGNLQQTTRRQVGPGRYADLRRSGGQQSVRWLRDRVTAERTGRYVCDR